MLVLWLVPSIINYFSMLEPIFISFISNKFVTSFMKSGNKHQAEILSFKLLLLVRQLYTSSIIGMFYTLILRFKTPIIVRSIRIGARKYNVPQPIAEHTQVNIAIKGLFVNNERRVFRLYKFLVFVLQQCVFNKIVVSEVTSLQ